ncbi:MAG: GyrI-like domain-containing protein [Eubacteriales bacterium]
MPIDYKKIDKHLYLPQTTPGIIEVPEMAFLMVDGKGDPNTSAAYATALELLYGLSYTIKMSPKSGQAPLGHVDYVVPPLEGLWSLDDGGEFKGAGAHIPDKGQFVWTAMIRQPSFVTAEVVETAKQLLARKKPSFDLSRLRFEIWTEGLCAQLMHLGPYDEEPASIAALHQFIHASGCIEDFSPARRHHEIYLADPRKTAPDKLKTVIRHPIRRIS